MAFQSTQKALIALLLRRSISVLTRNSFASHTANRTGIFGLHPTSRITLDDLAPIFCTPAKSSFRLKAS